MTDNGIYLVDKQTGAYRTIVEGKLGDSGDLAVTNEGGKETVHVADVFSYRTVDGQRCRRRRAARAWRDACPSARPSIGPRHVLLTSWFSNTVEKVDRKTGKLVATLGDFAAPVDALEAADGTLYVAELASANLVNALSPTARRARPWSRSCAGRQRWRRVRAT